MKQVYLDHNATTAVDPRVLESMLPYFSVQFGNAASVQHEWGAAAADAVDAARHRVADLIGAEPSEIIFTSGATESNNLALKGAAEACRTKRHIISSSTEHPSILDCLKRLGHTGMEVTLVPVDRYGVPDLEVLQAAIRPDTLLLSIMGANNEIGTIAPLRAIGEIARSHGVLLHCDGAQLVGKVPLDVETCNIDLLSISSHKMYGPKGVGALYVRRRPSVPLVALVDGGGHELGLRSGTVNVPGVVGFGVAAALAQELLVEEAALLTRLRNRLWCRLVELIPNIYYNGHPVDRLPGSLSVCFVGVDSDALMVALPHVAMSSGSACSAASPRPSHVLLAIGVPYEEAGQTIRFGVGRFTTEDDVDWAAKAVADAVARIRDLAGDRE